MEQTCLLHRQAAEAWPTCRIVPARSHPRRTEGGSCHRTPQRGRRQAQGAARTSVTNNRAPMVRCQTLAGRLEAICGAPSTVDGNFTKRHRLGVPFSLAVRWSPLVQARALVDVSDCTCMTKAGTGPKVKFITLARPWISQLMASKFSAYAFTYSFLLSKRPVHLLRQHPHHGREHPLVFEQLTCNSVVPIHCQ